MNLLQNKVALVTGGTSGLGRETALALAAEAAKVVVTGRDRIRGEEAADAIAATGGEAAFFPADVTSERDIEALIARAVEVYGRVDCAVNSAGLEGSWVPTAEYSESEWNAVIDVNLKGLWLCMKHELLQMVRQGGGVIVNVASAYGLVGGGPPAYVASKHAVVGLTKNAALEYGRHGVRVVAVCPGAVRGEMNERLIKGNPDAKARMLSRYPLGRIAEPREVTDTIIWLCSDAASFVSGNAFVIDGGRSAG